MEDTSVLIKLVEQYGLMGGLLVATLVVVFKIWQKQYEDALKVVTQYQMDLNAVHREVREGLGAMIVRMTETIERLEQVIVERQKQTDRIGDGIDRLIRDVEVLSGKLSQSSQK